MKFGFIRFQNLEWGIYIISYCHDLLKTVLEVGTVAQDVLCEVSNCVYNMKGSKCGAKQIYVVSHKGTKADSSHETDCQTFKPEE